MENFSSHDFYVIRRPRFSVEDLLDFSNQLQEKNEEAFQQHIKQLYANQAYQEAIYVASPDLHKEMLRWLDGEEMDPKSIHKLSLTLYKYLCRMHVRCTPYGLFAGCLTGEIRDQNTTINFDSKQKIYKHSRLDMNYVSELVQYLLQKPEIRNQLTFFPNNSLYRIADQYRYSECRLRNKTRDYVLSSIKSTPYIELVLAIARKGATIDTIVEGLLQLDDIEKNEAQEFIDELIGSQVLLSELEPTVTGEEFFLVLIAKLQKLNHTEEILQNLIFIKENLESQDANVEKYKNIEHVLKQNFTKTSAKDLIQVDLFYKTQQNILNKKAVDSVSKDLRAILPYSILGANPDLNTFKRRFYDRYEEKEVPLVLALDNDLGIGYGSAQGSRSDNTPLIEGLMINGRRATDKNTAWGRLQQLKHKKFQEAIHNKQTVVKLTNKDLESIDKLDKTPIIDSFFLMGSLYANSTQSIDNNDFKFSLNSYYGPSAANILGRFCHGDTFLAEKVKDLLTIEESFHEDVIYAEVVHLPEARIGNILLRPQLRSYEIPYLGNSSVDLEHQITIDDLMISVRAGEIILKSKRLNKRVFPRLSTAHNFHIGLPVYRFLCDLQGELGRTFIDWDWGTMFSKEPFHPRIEFGNIILSKAKWFIRKSEIPPLPSNNIKEYFEQLCTKMNIPRYVLLSEGDNELLLDMSFQPSLSILLEKLKKRSLITLTEFLGTPNNCFLEENGRKITNELVIPFSKEQKTVSQTKQSLVSQPVKSPQRTFIPGSEWLYIKIYTGTKANDTVLSEIIKPLAEELIDIKAITKWFFIRYRDTDEHIRIRFHNDSDKDFWKYVLGELEKRLKPYIENEIVSRIQIDTYHREIERYGKLTMELSEEVFYHDSVAVVNFIDMLSGDEGEYYRWLFALRGVDTFLDAFGYSLSQKYELLQERKHSFFMEFGGGEDLQVQLNNKYRSQTSNIEAILNAVNKNEELTEAIEVFDFRTKQLAAIATKLNKINEDYPTSFKVSELMPSYLHMFLNRLFLSNQRLHELVIYHYLEKYYKSQLARQKKNITVS